MKGKIFVTVFLVCALSSMVIFGVFAQAGSLGVKAGDNFTYSFDVVWSSTNPSKVVPTEFSDMNKTRSIHVNVTDVGLTIAYVDISKRMIDGTQVNTPGFIVVTTGHGVEAQLFIIGANLTAGDEVYPLSEGPPAAAESFTITETVTLTYLGTSREVNHYHESKTDVDGTVTRDAYYDRATGILLEMTISHSFVVNVDETDSEHWKITQFNSVETPSDGTTDGTNGTGSTGALPDWVLYAVIVAVVVVVAALAAVVVLRRRKKPEVEAPEPSPVEPQPPV
jgi:hypothetical protein